MTVTTTASGQASPPVELVTCRIDGIDVSVPKGTLTIRAADQLGIEVPRFGDHPLLSPVAACRMCLVESEGQPKPQPACAVAVGDKMIIKTQMTSEVADTAQRGVMEFLLINHPLDCPVCDKGGECPLQNQAMTAGHAESRFEGVKRTFPKPINVSAQILLDRERCVSCARCTRFADEIAGDPFIELLERGAKQQVGTAEDQPFDSYFSGNTVQICPVGALTSADYRFKARPFDLVSTPTTCEHCASGCGLRTDDRRNKVQRRLALEDYEVNEEWNCDKGRFAFRYLTDDRLTHPLIRDEEGDLVPASWPEAINFAAAKLAEVHGKVGVLTGGRLTREDAYAYAKFARVALGSDDIDFRARAASTEEAEFLAAHVAGTGLGLSYADIEKAPIVLLVGIEPEEESPIVFLRLRKAVLAGTAKVAAISSWASPGFAKTGGTVLAAAPGAEAEVLAALGAKAGSLSEAAASVADALREPGAVILVGERLAANLGGISAAVKLAGETGASLSWIPRRAGERGALDAGALAGVLPGGRPITDSGARAEVAAAWGIDEADLPAEPGLQAAGIIEALLTPPVVDEEPAPGTEEDDALIIAETAVESAAAADDEPGDAADAAAEDPNFEAIIEEPEPRISGLVIGGVEINDMPDPEAFRLALKEADVVISLETRLAGVDAYADVVFPVSVDTERSGSYVNWEGRIRPFGKVLRDATTLTDGRVLAMIADELDRPIATEDSNAIRREIDGLGFYSGTRPVPPAVTAPVAATPGSGQALLASWRHLLDLGILQAGEQYLAATQRPSVVRLSAATAAGIGVSDAEDVTVSSESGSITLPLVITDMPDGVVWVPGNSPGSAVNASLSVVPGTVVSIARGGQA